MNPAPRFIIRRVSPLYQATETGTSVEVRMAWL